ncbi:hypothetical protein [Streptomyces sp. SID10815]|uniref:hypothetical protein n=1 Tax=Streptomyces sp. SID10815 TaxID=2706027 RepID=UPI0013C8A3FB|nr:hypothetical protein [Streptomyces sp. SID10815]NEA49728.1 hypothetical protein [Streptomyces sp. SID10815]
MDAPEERLKGRHQVPLPGAGRVDVLASVLEDIAEHGYPAAESGVLWEEARDAHLERLAGEQP